MIRTQISLDEGDYKLVKKESRARGISIAEFVRRAVREQLPPAASPPWMRCAALVETGDPRSRQSIDQTVYGSKP
jgi:ribbon-helix-helix CopG family protein